MGLFSYMTGFGGRDMAVDLGTANTLVYVRGRGIVLSEPSVVAIDSRTGEVHAVGIEAKRMLGRTPGTISAIRPLKDGVIADFDVTEEMLRHFIQKVHQSRFAHPRVVVCVPVRASPASRSARSRRRACPPGARQAYLIEEPMAAAIGAGLPVGEPTGSMVVDIGGGTSEVAVISLGGIVVSQSIRIGGDELDEAIINYAKREYKLLIGQQTAEELKLEIGSAFPMAEELQAEIRGRDMVSGLPKTVVLTSEEIRVALEEPLAQIIDAVKVTLDRTPPELASDIMDRGIVLAGGGALLQGLADRVRDETQMPTHLAESPLTCVAVGSGRSLEEFEVIHRTNRTNGTARRRAAADGRIRAVPARRARTLYHDHHLPVHDKTVRRRRAVLALLVVLSLILISASFGSSGGGLHTRAGGLPRRPLADRVGREQGPDAGPRPLQLRSATSSTPPSQRDRRARRYARLRAAARRRAGAGPRRTPTPPRSSALDSRDDLTRRRAGHRARDLQPAEPVRRPGSRSTPARAPASRSATPSIGDGALVGTVTAAHRRLGEGDARRRQPPPARRRWTAPAASSASSGRPRQPRACCTLNDVRDVDEGPRRRPDRHRRRAGDRARQPLPAEHPDRHRHDACRSAVDTAAPRSRSRPPSTSARSTPSRS